MHGPVNVAKPVVLLTEPDSVPSVLVILPFTILRNPPPFTFTVPRRTCVSTRSYVASYLPPAGGGVVPD